MSYILVLTMIFKSGNGGMGGIEHIEVDSYEKCQRIGRAWVESVKKERKYVMNKEIIFIQNEMKFLQMIKNILPRHSAFCLETVKQYKTCEMLFQNLFCLSALKHFKSVSA